MMTEEEERRTEAATSTSAAGASSVRCSAAGGSRRRPRPPRRRPPPWRRTTGWALKGRDRAARHSGAVARGQCRPADGILRLRRRERTRLYFFRSFRGHLHGSCAILSTATQLFVSSLARCSAGLRSDSTSSREEAASPTEIRAVGGLDDEDNDDPDGSLVGTARHSVRDVQDALTRQGTARRHAAIRRAKECGAAAATAAHAIRRADAKAERGAALVRAHALETKLAAAEAHAAAEPAPAMADNSPLRATDVVFHDDDDNRHPEEEIKERNDGMWDSDDDGVLDEEEECMACEQSAAAAAAAFGLRPQPRRVIDDDCDAELCTGVMRSREEPSSPPAPDYAIATGRTYDDITVSPPPYLRCVASPLSTLPPVLQCTAAS